MYLRNLLVMFVLATALSGLIGCSSNPMSTDLANGSINSLPVIDLSEGSNYIEMTGLFGAYDMTVDTESMSAELVPKRISSLGESYIVCGMGFFTMAPCTNCLQIDSIGADDDGFTVGFEISHPFDPGNPDKPPTARNRLDLNIFDLAMVVVPQDSEPTFFESIGDYVYTDVLSSASGYTTELASLLEDDSAMPYQLVVDDSITGETTYNAFNMGVTSFFDDQFGPPIGKVVSLSLYLTMGYGVSASKNTFLQPKYYNPEFNRKPAWKVEVVPPEGVDPPMFGNTWSDNDPETPYEVTVKVYDWQIGANVNPDLAIPTDVYAPSEVGEVIVEIPGMDVWAVPGPAHDGTGTGKPNAPLVYHIPMMNSGLMDEGEYTGLVKVVDTRAVGTVASRENRDHLIHTTDGIELLDYLIPEYVTYQTFTATVVTGPPGVVIQQIDYTLDDHVVKDSAYGSAKVNYFGTPDVQYFNLNVDGVWVIRNIPLYPFMGEGVYHSVYMTFDLGVPDGTDVGVVNMGWIISTIEIPGIPPAMGPTFVYPRETFLFSGIYPYAYDWPFLPDGMGLYTPGPSNWVNFPGPNQDCNRNECVPAAVSNSLQWLQSTQGEPPPNKGTDIATMRGATGCGNNGAPFGWTGLKDEYMNVNHYNIDTNRIPEPPWSQNETSEAECDAAMAQLAAGNDVEIQGGHHLAMVVGMTKGVDQYGFPKYTITVVHDTAQGQSGGTVAETITYCPPVPNPSPPPDMFQSETDGGSPGFFDNDTITGWVSESAQP